MFLLLLTDEEEGEREEEERKLGREEGRKAAADTRDADAFLRWKNMKKNESQERERERDGDENGWTSGFQALDCTETCVCVPEQVLVCVFLMPASAYRRKEKVRMKVLWQANR